MQVGKLYKLKHAMEFYSVDAKQAHLIPQGGIVVYLGGEKREPIAHWWWNRFLLPTGVVAGRYGEKDVKLRFAEADQWYEPAQSCK